MFQPWHCANHWGGDQTTPSVTRLLILGESHHSDEHEVGSVQSQLTVQVVNAYLDGSLHRRSKPFFSKLTRLVSGQPWYQLGRPGLRDAWNRLAFYNYIPRIAARGPRNNPYRAEWMSEAAQRFDEVVQRLQPEAILVCGERLWWHLPAGESVIDAKVRTRFYKTGFSERAVAVPMNHPSSPGWSAAKWRPALEFLFEQVALEKVRLGVLLQTAN